MIKCTFENGNETSLRHTTVDTLVLNQNQQVLLVKRAKQLIEGGKWALVGGYVDRDENLIEAVAREVTEETGFAVSNIELLTIRDNPDRPHEDRQNISFVFTCEAVERRGESDWEVEEQRWFELDDLPDPQQIAFDHYANLELYKRVVANGLTKPVLSFSHA